MISLYYSAIKQYVLPIFYNRKWKLKMVMFATQHNKQSHKHFPLYFKQSPTQPKSTALSLRRKTGPMHKSTADSTTQTCPSYTQNRIGRKFNPLWVISMVVYGLGSIEINLIQMKCGGGLMGRTSCSLTGKRAMVARTIMTAPFLIHLNGWQ